MTAFKILMLFILLCFSNSNAFANSSTPSYLQNEINEAHKAYLFKDTATGLYALNALARLLKFIGPDELSIEGTKLNLALTYFRIGLLHEKNGDELLKDKYFSQAIELAPNSEGILTNDFRSLANKLDHNFSE
ncbi:hypothetical protein CWC11_13055 [Pseudoalteromonas sp. S3178]|uniref:hypothetical protein n=1 Tax=Pseudoalteromonas sp. S3178 TaxID=579532 RepID=UPI00110A86AC|nr:hypothetical protein [Pseudoalteromonas sp. S3178]TMP03719.1 hypothetical protein CWC11_13055 [Pseudoalteromonas sp. S3178]